MDRKIIIPAAGDAVRFGGLPKELLPISETDCSLTRACRLAFALEGVPVVITNPVKEPLHRAVLERAGLPVEFKVRRNWRHKDLWGSIELGLDSERDGGLILADTVPVLGPLPLLSLLGKADCALAFGVFETRTPERFSIVTPNGIATKRADAPGDLAWGMLLWTAEVAAFLQSLELDHYDRALEAAMQNYSWDLFRIERYHDLGTFAAYKQFLLEQP